VQDPEHPWYRRQLWRANTHKALNALIQGSAARHTKLWMRACWREGIVPLLQMHDELDLSVSGPEQAERVAQLGCEAVTLEVPMLVDAAFGRSWGDAKHRWQEVHAGERTIVVAAPQPPVSRPLESTPPKINGVHVLPPASEESIVTEADPEVPPWQTIPLADLIGEELHNGKICCPFHDDHHPSLHVYADHFFCFVCKARGNHIDWLREVEGLSYDAAIELLLGGQGREHHRPTARW
jgi:hypothetical protein